MLDARQAPKMPKGVMVYFTLCKHTAIFACIITRVSRYPLSLRADAIMMSRGLTGCIICHQCCFSFITFPVRHTTIQMPNR